MELKLIKKFGLILNAVSRVFKVLKIAECAERDPC